jgi:hypothetical protein
VHTGLLRRFNLCSSAGQGKCTESEMADVFRHFNVIVTDDEQQLLRAHFGVRSGQQQQQQQQPLVAFRTLMSAIENAAGSRFVQQKDDHPQGFDADAASVTAGSPSKLTKLRGDGAHKQQRLTSDENPLLRGHGNTGDYNVDAEQEARRYQQTGRSSGGGAVHGRRATQRQDARRPNEQYGQVSKVEKITHSVFIVALHLLLSTHSVFSSFSFFSVLFARTTTITTRTCACSRRAAAARTAAAL